MAIYRVHFVDHGEHVFDVQNVEHDTDEDAIRAARNMNAPSIGVGFDIWHDGRLVHQHRNRPLRC
jgi:hypothetical protein